MLLRIIIVVLFAAYLCVAASAAFCMPTASSQVTIFNPSLSEQNISIESACSINNFVFNNSPLNELSAQLLTPPDSTEVLTTLSSASVKSLPGVPAAVFMAIFGFFCVSFVKDRRFWLAVIAAIFWIGYAGIQTLPQLAQRFTHSNTELSLGELKCNRIFDGHMRSRSNLEGTEYIGLLNYLEGIPNSSNIHFNINFSSVAELSHDTHSKVCVYPQNNTYSSLFVFSPEQLNLNLQSSCLDSKAEQSIVFTPAFIFNLIPRGPPILASKSFHTVGV